MSIEEFIKRHEGFRSRPYSDSLGNLTVGYGRALNRNPLTPAEAEHLFRNDCTRAVNAARAAVGPDVFAGLALERQAALVDMAFQLGAHGLSEFKAMIAAIQAGDWARAHMEALDSDWARQTPRRADECAEIFLTGHWPVN